MYDTKFKPGDNDREIERPEISQVPDIPENYLKHSDFEINSHERRANDETIKVIEKLTEDD